MPTLYDISFMFHFIGVSILGASSCWVAFQSEIENDLVNVIITANTFSIASTFTGYILSSEYIKRERVNTNSQESQEISV